MFGKHALEVRIKKNDKAMIEPETPSVTPDDVTRVAKKVVKYVALGFMGSFAAAVILNTASEITVHRMTTTPEKEEE